MITPIQKVRNDMSEEAREPGIIESYTSPRAYGEKYLRDLHLEECIVQEKVDGSQFSFGMIDEEMVYRSRGKHLVPEAADKMFADAIAAIEEVKGKLMPGWVYRGEVVHKPRHNVLTYERAASGVVLFDIQRPCGMYLAQSTVGAEAVGLGLDWAPVYRTLPPGTKYTPGMFEDDMRIPSVLGGVIEGVVIKNYARTFPDGKLLAAKWVSAKFKETNKTKYKTPSSGEDQILARIVSTYRTEARWYKALQHLWENGELTGSAGDIGPLMKEARMDLERECVDEIKDALYTEYRKKILDGVTNGLPQWYKERLAAGDQE